MGSTNTLRRYPAVTSRISATETDLEMHPNPMPSAPQLYKAISEVFTVTARPIGINIATQIRGVVDFSLLPKLKLLTRIRDISRYTQGWNGDEDSQPAEQAAVDEAENFLSYLPLDRIHAPVISLAADGEINFSWRTQSSTILDLGFYGTGEYSYYSRSVTGEEHFGNSVSTKKHLPENILSLLEKNGDR